MALSGDHLPGDRAPPRAPAAADPAGGPAGAPGAPMPAPRPPTDPRDAPPAAPPGAPGGGHPAGRARAPAPGASGGARPPTAPPTAPTPTAPPAGLPAAPSSRAGARVWRSARADVAGRSEKVAEARRRELDPEVARRAEAVRAQEARFASVHRDWRDFQCDLSRRQKELEGEVDKRFPKQARGAKRALAQEAACVPSTSAQPGPSTSAEPAAKRVAADRAGPSTSRAAPPAPAPQPRPTAPRQQPGPGPGPRPVAAAPPLFVGRGAALAAAAVSAAGPARAVPTRLLLPHQALQPVAALQQQQLQQQQLQQHLLLAAGQTAHVLQPNQLLANHLLGVLQASAASPGFQAPSPAQREQVLRQMLQGPPPGNSAAK